MRPLQTSYVWTGLRNVCFEEQMWYKPVVKFYLKTLIGPNFHDPLATVIKRHKTRHLIMDYCSNHWCIQLVYKLWIFTGLCRLLFIKQTNERCTREQVKLNTDCRKPGPTPWKTYDFTMSHGLHGLFLTK